MFKLHPANLPQIKATVAAYGTCYIHGDGNLYTTKEESDFRKDFSNPDSDESTYRVKFEKGDTIPATIDELETLLLNSKQKERMEEKQVKSYSAVKSIVVPVDKTSNEEVVIPETPAETEVKKGGRPKKEADETSKENV